LAATATGRIPTVPPAVLSVIALALGALVALGRPLPRILYGASIAAGAAAVGLDSVVETGGAKVICETLIGTWVGVNILLLNFIYYVSLAAETKKQWLAIGIRVAGSWIFAISVLMLAFALRK
jgi:hypothetical protein